MSAPVLVHTHRGSVYEFLVHHEEAYAVNYRRAIPNPARVLANVTDEWRLCTVTPWPPQLGERLSIVRPLIPWGQGQLTNTSPVRLVEWLTDNLDGTVSDWYAKGDC